MNKKQAEAFAAVLCRLVDYHVAMSAASRNQGVSAAMMTAISKVAEERVVESIQQLPDLD